MVQDGIWERKLVKPNLIAYMSTQFLKKTYFSVYINSVVSNKTCEVIIVHG